MPTDARPMLSAEEILRLQALGALVRRAHTQSERYVHVETVLLVARQHRDSAITWIALAHAIGVSGSTLRRWRRRDRPIKPTLLEPADSTITKPDRRPRDGSGRSTPRSEVAPAYAHQSQYTGQTATANSVAVTGMSSTTTSSLESLPPRRRVLVLTGDPRPGGNSFDPEVARIRECLHGTSVHHCHVAMVGLDEIAATIDRERSAVLHMCAHRGLGGLALSVDGRPLLVDPDDLAAAIERARHRPRCAILSFCASVEIAARLARWMPAVIAWPGRMEDQQAVCFAGQLYRQIALGTRLPEGVTEAGRVVASVWPELAPPSLHGRWRDPVL